MNIDFCGPAVPAQDGGISYRVKVDGQTVACRVSEEALQDIDPSSYQQDPMSQFEAHRSRLLAIAEKKILKGEVSKNNVWVFTADI